MVVLVVHHEENNMSANYRPLDNHVILSLGMTVYHQLYTQAEATGLESYDAQL